MYESFSMPNELENIRIQLRHAFDRYCNETSATESLIGALPFPPAGEDLKRLLIQQSKEREAFSQYQQARDQYVKRALNQMTAKASAGPTPI